MTPLQQAARAVVNRWETPLWKDAEPTAAVVYRLRDALEAELSTAQPEPLPALPEDVVMVPRSALRWLFGEEGEFVCPESRYFRGKPPTYWWRGVFRELIQSAQPEPPLSMSMFATKADYDAAVAPQPEPAAPKFTPCRGISDSVCHYLGTCGTACNKCGKVHDGKANPRPEPAAPRLTTSPPDLVNQFDNPEAAPTVVEPSRWEGGEGWESLAWELCADENGEDACNELIWEGGPIPEPWGDRWMKYEGEAKRLIALVHKHAATPPRAALTDEQVERLRGLDTDRRVRFYEHDFYVLSNFSAFNLRWDGNIFPTSEHAYHWTKFPVCAKADGRYIRDAILDAPSAHDAFKLAEGFKPHRRSDWDDVKVGIMRDILLAKAQQHEYVRRKLLDTGGRELVEDSWRDDFWGWGPNRDGQNMLGKLWMEVRAELRERAHGITADRGQG